MYQGRQISPMEYIGPGRAFVSRPMPCSSHELPPEIKVLQEAALERIKELKRSWQPVFEELGKLTLDEVTEPEEQQIT